MSEEGLYVGREQTLVKHFILRKYLERFAHIIGFHWNTITYVDCFSGPWKAQAEDLKDTSFSIALKELRKARTTHEERGKSIRLRCMFLEKDPAAYAKLKQFADEVSDVELQTRKGEFGLCISEVVDFVKGGGPSSFPFIFIDPTGWSGFEMQRIAPLLQVQPGEVLINFMTDHIRRFIDHPEQATREQFAALFGADKVKARIQDLSDPRDREDALFGAYAENVQKTGSFTHTCAAIVLYPDIDRSYFHLIYATRNRRGVEVFKGAEKRAMAVMEQTRAHVKQRKRVEKSRQPEMFSSEYLPHSRPIDELRRRYLELAQQRVLEVLRTAGRVSYERAWDLALAHPLVWDADLKEWIVDWKAEGLLTIEGMRSRQRVPKLDEGNHLLWLAPRREGGPSR